MNRFFNFIRMKYEQHMMRKLDNLLNRFEKNERYSDSLFTKYL